LKTNQTDKIIRSWQTNARKAIPAIRTFLKRFSGSLPPKRVLEEVHEEVFSEFDCLACASCCKNSSPVFTRADISRIAGHIGMKPGEMETRFLVSDKDGDFIPSSKPCPFLEKDNTCQVYEVRPKSCRGFPHTDNRSVWERHAFMAGNAAACPAAFSIVERFRTSAKA